MRQIAAIPLRFDDEQTITVPPDSTLLSVRMQGDTPTLFLLCGRDASNSGPSLTIVMRHTADREPVPDFGVWYLGSLQEQVGAPTFHTFAQVTPGVGCHTLGL